MKKTSKKLLALGLLLAALATPMQATTVGDTIVIEGPERVRIETRDTVQRIVIRGSKDDPYLHYVQRISIPDTSVVRRKLTSIKDFNKVTVTKPSQTKNAVTFSLNAAVGLSTMTGTPSGYDFRLWPSFDWTVMGKFDWRPFGRRNVWSAGLGVNTRSYRMADGSYWTKAADGLMALTPYADGQSHRRTELRTFSLQVPLLYTHNFDDRGRAALTLGALVNWNTGARAKRHYEADGEVCDVAVKSIGQRPVTVDAIAMLKLPSLPRLYCKYSPMTFFKDGRGPQMHQLSFGIFLF